MSTPRITENTSEMLHCPTCRQWYEAHAEDLGTYFCWRCQKPKAIDFKELERFIATSFKINRARLDKMKDHKETT